MADFAGGIALVLVPLILLGVAAAVVLFAVTTVVPPAHRILRVSYGGLGLLLGLGAAWLVLYASGPDTYYRPDEVSRWEHAGRWGGTTPVVAAVIGAAATSVLLAASAVVPPRSGARLLLPLAAALACGLLVAGWFFLTGGH